jgi:hypothetical protein
MTSAHKAWLKLNVVMVEMALVKLSPEDSVRHQGDGGIP